MRELLVVSLLVVGCSKNAGTPANTKVLDWTVAQGTREPIKTATLANKASKDTDYIGDHGVKLKLHVETATASYTEGSSQMNLPVVTALTVTVTDSNGYSLTKSKCDGPNYDMALPPTTTIIDCTMSATKKNDQSIVMWQMNGAGEILPPGKTTTIIDTSKK